MALALSNDGRITSISNTAAQLTGYSTAELSGRPVATILADRSILEFSKLIQSARDWDIWQGEIAYRNRSGNLLWAHATLAPLFNGNGSDRCDGFLLMSDLNYGPGNDAGPALSEVAAHLRETSHELNNPLAVIMGFTQLILLDSQCDGKMRSEVERLYSEMKRLIQVVERLHAYAVSLQTGRPVYEQSPRT